MMNSLPSKWAYKNIKDVLLPLADGKLLHQGWSPRCEPEPSHKITEWAALKTTAIQDGWYDETFNKRLPKTLSPKPELEVHSGDILITCAGPRSRCGVACLVKETRPRLMISGKMYRFRADESRVIPEFLLAYLRSNEGQAAIDKMKTGGNESGLNLTQERFFRLNVVVPPLDVQRLIIDKSNSLSKYAKNAEAELSRVPRLVERYKQAVLAAAFRGELTAEWRKGKGKFRSGTELLREIIAAYPAPEKERSKLLAQVDLTPATNLPDIPDTWTWAPVWLLSSKVTDGVHKKPEYVDDGVPFLTVKNLTVGPGITFSDCRYVTQEDHEEFIKRTNPENGDILITKDGTLGVVRAIRTDTLFSIFVSLALVKPVDRSMTDYLELAFTSPQVQQQMTGVGTGLQHIHLTDLRRDLIPIAPKAERDEIVRRVSVLFKSIDKMNDEAVRANALVNRLDQATLAKAFRGELLQEESINAVSVR